MIDALILRDVRAHWRPLMSWAVTAAALITLQLSVYPTVRESSAGLKQFIAQYPEVFKKIFRIQDYTSAPGYLEAELFSLMLPLVFIAVGGAWGAGFTAEEEEQGTADLLLALPVSRPRVLLAKSAAAFSSLTLVGVVCYATLSIGTDIVNMSISLWRLAAGVGVCVGLGMLFCALAALLGAATGRKGAALGISVGLALALFVLYSLAPLVSTFDAVLPYNPFQWTLGSNPLTRAFTWTSLAKPLAVALILTFAAVLVFRQRDLRQL